MKKILILNGPNINLIGKREPAIYGNESFDSYFSNLAKSYTEISFIVRHSNYEGELITLIQEYGFDCDGIILNAGGYTHTSIAIRDAISAVSAPVIEVHISNIYSREEFRRNSIISGVCKGSICGFGLKSYKLAVEAFID